jgi:transcriptional regulator with PAS, ATPase and Fis domain
MMRSCKTGGCAPGLQNYQDHLWLARILWAARKSTEAEAELRNAVQAATSPLPCSSAGSLTLSQGIEQTEILRITEVLRKHGNNRVRTAAELGISRMSLYKKLRKYRLLSNA